MVNSKLKYLFKQFPFIYPKGFIRSARQYIDRIQSKARTYSKNRYTEYHLIDEIESYFLPAAQSLQTGWQRAFTLNQAYRTTPKYLFFLPDSFVSGNKGIIANNRNYIFEEFTHNFNISGIKGRKFNRPFQQFSLNIKYVSGTTASLLSPQSHNIYHWFFDVLSRIRLYDSVKQQIDHFLVADTVPEHLVNLLSHFYIPADKIIRVNDKEKLHLQYLYVSTLPGSEGRSSQKDVDYLTSHLASPCSADPLKKIFIKRGDVSERNIINEKELINRLEAAGFIIADTGKLSIAEQRKLFSNVSVIVSNHGAALFNLLFAPAGCKVLELFSPDYFRTDCYYNLASLKKIDYWYILGNKPPGSKWGDCHIDLPLLADTLTSMQVPGFS